MLDSQTKIVELIDRACSIDHKLDIQFDTLNCLSNNNDEFPCPQHPRCHQRNEPLHQINEQTRTRSQLER